MKNSFLLLFLWLIVYSPSTAQDTTHILFIGNSITYFNSMPQNFEAIANSKGKEVQVTMYAPGGTGFVNHVVDPNVFDLFREGKWDFIVLQPGSNESPGYSYPINETLERARVLKDSIELYNPCAKKLYYEISYGVWGDTPENLNTYNTTMDLIRSNLEYLADSTEFFFAPVGEAFRTSWNNDQTDILWGGFGDIHPNAKGSYIAACVFYATIFQEPSLGTSVTATLTPQEAEESQNLADATVLSSLADWRINTYNQFTDFDYTLNGTSVEFSSTSQNIDSLLWSFGDGTSSNNPLVTHDYVFPNQYTVTLTTYKGECSETVDESIIVSTSFLNEVGGTSDIVVYPNPVHDQLFVEFDESKEYTFGIYTIHGELVKQFESSATNVDDLSSGTYLLLSTNKGSAEVAVSKFCKE